MTSKKKLINPLHYIKKESPSGIVIYGKDSEERNKYMKKVYKQCKDAGACLYDESSEDVINKLSINKNNKKDSVIFFSIGEHIKMDGATCQALNEYLLFGSSLRAAIVISVETKEELLNYIGSDEDLIIKFICLD